MEGWVQAEDVTIRFVQTDEYGEPLNVFVSKKFIDGVVKPSYEIITDKWRFESIDDIRDLMKIVDYAAKAAGEKSN